MIKIDKNVEIPPRKVRGAGKYPWESMIVGDSFLADPKGLDSVSVMVSRASKRYGMKFSCRQTGDGIRVWRTR